MASVEHDDTASESSEEAVFDRRPSLEPLVSHFVASKRSLASVNHVWRANEIVETARASVEKIAYLCARNNFLRRAIDGQMLTLQTVRHGVTLIGQDGQADFKDVLRKLDVVDLRVQETLNLLRTTVVEASFRPEDEAEKCLYDFVDEHGVDGIRSFFRECIDHTNDAQNVLADSIDAFDAELQVIASNVDLKTGVSHEFDHSTTASTFQSLENLATEMANHLQSLVRHYDLCMTALKHTEGGGEAAEQASVDLPAGVEVGGLDRDAPPVPISEDERLEMLQVLENDAAEVEEVVQDIRDQAAEMEFQLEQIVNQLQMVESQHNSLSIGIQQLGRLGSSLPEYINATSIFKTRWDEQKSRILKKMDELDSVGQFYGGFLHAYDGLILEIVRRKRAGIIMERIVDDAMVELQKVYKVDLEERESFKLEQGAYLPSDLWPGLINGPPRYDISLLNQESSVLPEVSEESVQRALHRVQRTS